VVLTLKKGKDTESRQRTGRARGEEYAFAARQVYHHAVAVAVAKEKSQQRGRE